MLYCLPASIPPYIYIYAYVCHIVANRTNSIVRAIFYNEREKLGNEINCNILINSNGKWIHSIPFDIKWLCI